MVKIASLVLICVVALAFVSGCIMTSFADPDDPPITPAGNGNPHKKSSTITTRGNGNPHRGNGNPHR